MTDEDEQLRDAIIDQLNAERGAQGLSMRDMAEKIGRPYDSTRNYLKKERAIPLIVLVECATALDLPTETIIARARQRLR